MKKALMGVSAAAAIALAPICVPTAQAHADPCLAIFDPAARQPCIAKAPHDSPVRRYPLGDCEGASPVDGQVGQVCG